MKTTLTIFTKRTTVTDNNTFRVCSATATVKSATKICLAYYSDSKHNKFCVSMVSERMALPLLSRKVIIHKPVLICLHWSCLYMNKLSVRCTHPFFSHVVLNAAKRTQPPQEMAAHSEAARLVAE